MEKETAICALLKEAKQFDTEADASVCGFAINQKWQAQNVNKAVRIDGGRAVGFWLLVWETDFDGMPAKLLGLVAED